MPAVKAQPQPGEVFAGKYLIERTIGSGRNSVVFVAQHGVTGKRFAIEWLVPGAEHLVSEVEHIESDEQQVVGHFRHPNVLEVYDVGEEAGSLYTVMEWSEGESLEARIARTGPMPFAVVCDLLVPCMRGIHAAHDAGILHCNLKPSNIFLCQSSPSEPEIAKVLGFELIAEVTDGTGASGVVLTRRTRENPSYYQAPEQLGGHTVDRRADVYGFGAIFYEGLIGRPPFSRVTSSNHARPSSAELPRGAIAILGRAMARDVAQRFQNLEEFADALESVARSPVERARPPRYLARSSPTLPGRLSRTTAILAVGAFAFVCLVGFMAWEEWSSNRGEYLRGAETPLPRGVAPDDVPEADGEPPAAALELPPGLAELPLPALRLPLKPQDFASQPGAGSADLAPNAERPRPPSPAPRSRRAPSPTPSRASDSDDPLPMDLM